MAGIGFELRKVIGKGGVSNLFNAALSGILIVAGPWLLTILTIFFIRQFFDAVKLEHAGLFQAAVIYCYAFSLSLFSVVHFLFTRLTADLLWEKKERHASTWLLRFLAGTALASLVLGGVPLAVFPLEGVSDPLFFKLAILILFCAVNLLWLLMLFISLLKRYILIMLVYLGGMTAAVALVFFWGSLWGVSGAVLGFAAGHLLIVASLLVLGFKNFPPIKLDGAKGIVRGYLSRYSLLLLSGFLFYAGQWADKIFFWFTRGQGVEGTFFQLYDRYDLPVYLAGLTIIPGLVYFVIFSETAFYFALQKFLNGLVSEPYIRIQQAKFHLIRIMNQELLGQTVFQGFFSGFGILLAAWFQTGARLEGTVIAIAGAFLLLLLMTLLNFLYYFELYRFSFIGALTFFVFNAVFFPLVGWAVPEFPAGSGFVFSAAAACGVSYGLLAHAVKTIDRRIFLKSVV